MNIQHATIFLYIINNLFMELESFHKNDSPSLEDDGTFVESQHPVKIIGTRHTTLWPPTFLFLWACNPFALYVQSLKYLVVFQGSSPGY